MALFDRPTQTYPKKWKDMSLEYQLMFIYHGCMMALFITNGAFSRRQELAITVLLAAVLTSISIRHRHETNWHWRHPSWKGVISAAGILVAGGLFIFSATPLFSPASSRFLPWHLAVIGIGVFGALAALNLVRVSKAVLEGLWTR